MPGTMVLGLGVVVVGVLGPDGAREGGLVEVEVVGRRMDRGDVVVVELLEKGAARRQRGWPSGRARRDGGVSV